MRTVPPHQHHRTHAPVAQGLRAACLVATVLSVAPLARAQTGPVVPASHIPPAVQLEVRALAREFDSALIADCAPEKCVSKGCAYIDHVAVDLPRTASLPGLASTTSEAGPGSVPPQEYLTEAVCQFAFEKSVGDKDVRALQRRLAQRLSKAWLKVSVVPEQLEPVPATLRESPPDKPPPPPPPDTTDDADKKPEPPAPWTFDVAVRELWSQLLPHFAWMIAVVLATLAALVLIWGGRRLGKESVEEKLVAAQLADGSAGAAGSAGTNGNGAAAADAALAAENAKSAADAAADAAFVKEQERLWTERITNADPHDGTVLPLFREWLRAGEFDLLAKAVFVFGDKVSQAISGDAELAMKKMEFAEHLKNVEESELPPPSEFFRRLNHHAVSSLLLSQDDVQIYRSLVEEFGSQGILRLTEALGPHYGALMLAMVPLDAQRGAVQIMTAESRVAFADTLLASTRISREETAYLFDVLRAAKSGTELPAPPAKNVRGVVDRGREIDAAGALSALLSRIDPAARALLFQRALQRFGGSLPQWYENIVYGDMLTKLRDDLKNDIVLDVEVGALAAWLSVQDPVWAETFAHTLPTSVQSALEASRASSASYEHLQLVRQGQHELATAMKKQAARGRLSFQGLLG